MVGKTIQEIAADDAWLGDAAAMVGASVGPLNIGRRSTWHFGAIRSGVVCSTVDPSWAWSTRIRTRLQEEMLGT